MPRKRLCSRTCCNPRPCWRKPIINNNRRCFHFGRRRPISRKRLARINKMRSVRPRPCWQNSAQTVRKGAGVPNKEKRMSAESTAAEITRMPAPSSAEKAERAVAPSSAEEDKKPSAAPAAAEVGKAEGGSRWRALIPIVILLLAAAIFFAITGNWNSWVGSRETQETDDAYLRADLTPLSTRVSGTVAQVAVNDYQKVKAGDLLVQLKDDDYRAQVEQAVAGVRAAEAAIENNQRQKALQDARIAQAQAGIEAAKAQIEQAQAGIEASKAKIVDAKAAVEATKADVVRTESERRRQESLVEASAATRQRLEQVVADADRFRSILASREAELEQANAGLAVRKSDLAQAEAALLGRNADWEAQR